jgi:hypothetical protein
MLRNVIDTPGHFWYSFYRMLNTKLLLSLMLCMFLGCLVPVYAGDDGGGEDFTSSPIGKELINLGLKFLDNPGDFFYNLHSDNEDYSPVPSNRRGAVRFNFFPTFLPVTWGNLNMKVKVLDDRGCIPQVDLVGMYGDLLALRALDSGDVKPTFNDYSVGMVVSKGANPKTRIFGGLKYTVLNMDVQFSSPVVSGSFEMTGLNFKIADTFIFSGLSHNTGPEQYVVAQVGYGFAYKKIVSRIMVSHRHLELGMDIYPEGLFVFHPFLAWHWYF